ncbi:MAG: hypothetical protein HC849_34265 [Oscillatoriales cyanobacterium RU_3_3]|nr:hypothetical protein [Oscillatoriales cyanobacterium RU_3_3]NJR26083.1 hypothetical protein [Richelia sp. CSU_2_1]
MDAATILLIVIFVIGSVIWFLLAYLVGLFNNRRQEAFHVWAKLHNWSYDCRQDRKNYRHYSVLNRLQKGSNRYAFDTLKGTWNGYQAEAFNFHYETYSTSSHGSTTTTTTHHHYLGVVIIQIERSFPELVIFPQNFMEKMRNAVGARGIKFESLEFSKKFTVLCKNKKFAWDFCHARMMEYLLARPEICLELENNIFALYKPRGNINPDNVEEGLIKLCDLRQLMPEYLFRS